MKATLIRSSPRKAIPPRTASDGERTAVITSGSLTVTEGKRSTKLGLARPQFRGKDVEILAIGLAPGANVLWALLSDTFAIAQGRFVARLSWTAKRATWGPLKSPYGWSPYTHAGMFLDGIGAATADTAFITAFSEDSSVLGRVGKRAHKGVPIARGIVAFGTSPPSLVVFADRKFRFYDATGGERAGFGFSGEIQKAIGRPRHIYRLALRGRALSIETYDGVVELLLDEDPPALVPVDTPAPPRVVETTGPYGALDPARFRSPLIIAAERVRAWDLNQTPVFAEPAPFAALVLHRDVLSFHKERDGRLRKSFDFSASAVAVTTSAAPRGTPKGIVLASLRTPSGLTQVLCREELAVLLAANTGPRRKRPR